MGAYVRLRARIALLVAAGALLVAVGVALLLGNTVGLRSSADSTVRADDYLVRVIDVERLVVDVETGLRGYVITGRPLFLQPLHAAEALLPAATKALKQAALANDAYLPQADALVAAVHSYISSYVDGLLPMAEHDLRAARTFAVTLEGKRRVDSIRAQTAVLERLVSARLAANERAAGSSADRSTTEAIVALVALTLLTLVLGGILGHLAVGRERARELSESTSQTIQESILPGRLPAIPGCELAARFIPAAGLVGGDFYDVFQVAEQRWAIVVGDVCGKGAPAAALTAMARWRLRSSLEAGATPADAMRSLNAAMLRQDLERRFVTVACVMLTLGVGDAHVTVACAGHPAPVFVPTTGPPTEVAATGDVLGLIPTVRLHTVDLLLSSGESLVVYTDGVNDQGAEPVRSPKQALQARPPEAGAEQLAGILESLSRELAGRHRDDVAILAVRFVGEAGGHREDGAAERRVEAQASA